QVRLVDLRVLGPDALILRRDPRAPAVFSAMRESLEDMEARVTDRLFAHWLNRCGEAQNAEVLRALVSVWESIYPPGSKVSFHVWVFWLGGVDPAARQFYAAAFGLTLMEVMLDVIELAVRDSTFEVCNRVFEVFGAQAGLGQLEFLYRLAWAGTLEGNTKNPAVAEYLEKEIKKRSFFAGRPLWVRDFAAPPRSHEELVGRLAGDPSLDVRETPVEALAELFGIPAGELANKTPEERQGLFDQHFKPSAVEEILQREEKVQKERHRALGPANPFCVDEYRPFPADRMLHAPEEWFTGTCDWCFARIGSPLLVTVPADADPPEDEYASVPAPSNPARRVRIAYDAQGNMLGRKKFWYAARLLLPGGGWCGCF
ncbi:MAG: hypothetical protein KAX19_00690, partial [Candidatus Brocadiae bacterium]|nr:hypothetical protein [Candidatus Brocadiia bacterium]